MTKNITVTDDYGNILGKTYPKRAKGLIKNNRARYVSDSEISMNTCPSINLEDDVMQNTLYFNAREWSFNPLCDKNRGERCFITGFDDHLVEVYSIGNWSSDYTEIMSRPLTLNKNTTYNFTFWLNGGENDNANETCLLQILFDDDYENKFVYKLNRNFIKPTFRYKGWNLYSIPFTTGENEYTELRFVAQRAPMAVMSAKDASEYSALVEEVDAFERPQRHNIVFTDGWPTNTWYSTNNLMNKKDNAYAYSKGEDRKLGFNSNDITEDIKQRLMNEIDIDNIIDEVVAGISDEFSEHFSQTVINNVIHSMKNTCNE